MTIVGIDLGTTHSVVAAVVDGVPRVLQDANGDALVPSVVHFPEQGPPVVGRAAVAARQRDPANTFFSTKRLLGLPFTAPEVSAARAKFPFDVTDGPSNTVLARARGKFYTLPEISASILAYVKNLAGRALGETVTQAVITVPAHFNELQRASTKVAARVAGLEVVRRLNEPTAAALAYGLGLEPYLLATWHPAHRPGSLDFEPGAKWLGLEVRGHRVTGADTAEVEFVARHRVGGRAVRLHERSRFVREPVDGVARWLYLDGDLLG